MAGKVEKIEFKGSQGQMLAARLHRPDHETAHAAIFAHCFTCSKDVSAAARISSTLAAHGLAVLRFDFTGLGDSEGSFADTNFTSNISDLERAGEWLRTNSLMPSLLIGHSLGGAAVLAAAPRIREVGAVVTIGAPSDPAHIRHWFAHAEDEILDSGEAEVAIAGRTFRVRKQLFDDLDEQSLTDVIQGMSKALLIFHSPDDTVVEISHARAIYEAAQHPKSFISLAGADHMLSRRADADYAASVIAAWVDRYLD
ncbi:MAG: alpha/beta hydrolase family protein [Mariprofundaceae bacterium]